MKKIAVTVAVLALGLWVPGPLRAVVVAAARGLG